MVLSLGIIWIGFRSGFGLWALPLGSLFQQITSTLATAFMLRKLHLLPHSWWRQSSTWKGVSDLFLEALDFFSWSGFATAGATLQSVFLSRFLGLEAVAIWNVGAKLASFAYMLFANLFNTAFMGLSELFEKGELQNCLHSFRDLFISSLSCLTIFGACAALLNDYFIFLWTRGQIAFAPSCTWAIFSWLIFAGTLRALACFSNIWQNRKIMRIGPAVEFASVVLFLGLSLFAPSLKWFAFALMASQIPPILLSYGPSFLKVSKFFKVRLSNNQWVMISFSLAFFISAIGVRAFYAPPVQQVLLLLFLGMPWIYFFLKELNAFMLLRRN
jgi:O-antigen/teichoic acid export membrane protein